MMWREHGRVIGGWRSVVAPAALHARPQHHHDGHDGRQAPLQAPWRADADERPHQEAQVESADVHDEPFQDVRVAAQMGAPHPPGFVEMRVRAFQTLTAAPLQRPAARAAATASSASAATVTVSAIVVVSP